MELDAIEIRERARRRRGELLLALKAEGRLKHGARSTDIELGLEDVDISADESSRDQKIAKLDGNSYERLVARRRVAAF
jgi:hypothetical protein